MASSGTCASCLRALQLQTRRQQLPFHASTRTRHHLPTSAPFPVRSYAQTPPSSTSTTSPSKQPPPPPLPQPPPPDTFKSFASSLRKTNTLRSTTEPYVAYGGTDGLFRACDAQCTYTIPAVLRTPPEPPSRNARGEDLGEGTGWWFSPRSAGGLGLEVTFNTWAQVMYLHLYMLTTRLRAFPKEHAKVWLQNLLDHFFYAAEDRMAVYHGMSARGTRNKYLKEVLAQWRSALLSYDEGLIKGDAALAAAVWRNLYGCSVEADVGDLALVTGYVRRELKMLEQMSDETIASGELNFGAPAELRELVGTRSEGMRKAFSKEELEALGRDTVAVGNT